jgi:hypothetical protein
LLTVQIVGLFHQWLGKDEEGFRVWTGFLCSRFRDRVWREIGLLNKSICNHWNGIYLGGWGGCRFSVILIINIYIEISIFTSLCQWLKDDYQQNRWVRVYDDFGYNFENLMVKCYKIIFF